MLEDVSLCFLQTRISYSRIRGSYPFRRRARCTAADVDDISTPRRSAAARARETSQHQQNASDIIFNADFTVDHSLAASLIRPRRGRRGRVAPVIRDTSNRPLQELQRKYQGPAIPQAEEQNLDSLQQRGSPSQPGPDPLSQTQTHQKPITAPGSSPLRTRSKDHGNLPSQISPQCSALAVDGKAMEGASHLPECTPWRGEGVSMSGKNSRLSAAPSQKAQQQRSGGGLAPPPPPLVPAPMGGGMGPPAGSVMSGWALAGGQPQMNSVYRLIRKKELQHNYNHRHYPDQYVSERGANNSDDGGGELQQSRTGMSAPLSQRPPVRGSPGARDVSPRLGDVRRHRQMPPTQPKLQLQPQPQSPQRDDAQQRQRQGDGQASEGHVGSRLDSSLRPPPAALLAPFSSGHAAVDRVVRIRQIEMQRRQRRRNTDGDGGGGAGDGTNSCWDYGSRQASSWDARPPAGFGAGPASAATPTYVAPIAREGVWAIDKVPTALLGGRSGSVWGHGGSERKPDGGGGTDGAGDRNVIQVILASPSGVGGGGGGSGSGGGGGGRGGDDGEGSSVSSLLRETLMSDLSLLNPVYRMIRKHELLQRHPHPAAKASGSGSCSPSAAGTASPFISSPASSLDPWATDDFADVMLGGLMLTPPPPPPTASDQECISKSESGSGSIFRSGSAEAVSGTARSSRHAASDTASAVQAPGRLNPVLRLIRKKQLQRRLRLRGRLVPEIPTSAATTARSAPVTVGASDNVTATDGGDDAFSHASRSRGTAGGAGSGSGSSGSGDTIEEAAAWEIGPADAVGGRAVLNPVYRLIRKKQLQSKRASREAAAAAAAAAATADSSGRGGPGSDPAGLSPFRVAKDTGGETTTWQPRRAPFFDLGFGDYYGSFRSPASTLADALDPMAARSGSGSGPLPGLESDFMAASGNERDVVIQIDNTAAAGSAEPLVLPPASSLSSPSPQLLGSRVSDQLTSSMVGERPHMNHVYRLIRKKELQLRQRGVLPREAPAAATPVEGSTSAVHGDGRNGGGGGADVDASISNVRSAPVLLPLPLPLSATVVRPAASVRPSSGPPALLHPFDPVDDQDGVAVSGMGPAGTLMGYSSRLLMGGTYDEEQDEVYGDAGDDEGTFWSATSEEDSGDELDEHSEVLSSSRKNSLGLAPLALGRWPQADAKQHEAVLGQGLKARAVDAIETYTTSDATETPQGLRVQRRRRRKQEGKKVKVSEEGEEEREREKAVVVQDSSVVQMGLAVREGEEPDGKEATAAAAVVEAASYSKGKGQSQRQQFKRSHADALTGSAVAATATATVTALDGCLESTSTSRQHASGRRGRSRSRNDQDALLVAAGKESTVAADTSVAAASITKSSGDGHGGGLGDGVPCGVALITPRRRRIEELKASLRAKLLRLATTGGGGSGGGGGSANTNRTPQLLSGPSQRHYQSPPLSPPASPEAAAFAATKVRHEGSLPSAETAGACGCADALGATTSSAAAMAAVATDASRGAAASNTKDLDHSASITAVSRPHASGSVAAPPDDDIEREPAPAVTARPLPWQLTRRSSAATGGSASSFANGRSGIQIRRTGTAHRPPGLLRFLLETSPGPDGAEFSYATQAAVQNARGLRPDDSGGGNGVSSTAVRAPRRLFSGIAQLWDAVGLRVGPPPPTLPQADLDAATAAVAAASGRDLAQLEKLLVQEGVTEATARRLSGSWLVQSRGWEPKDVLERLRGLQRVLAGPVPSSVPPAHTSVPEATGAVPPLDAPTPPGPECSQAANEDRPGAGAGASTDWPRAGAGGDAVAPGITAAPGLAVAAAAAAKQPNLLTRDPAVLETNLRALATTLRMDRYEAQKMVRTWPSLLELRPASLAARLITLATGLGRINNPKSSGFQYDGQAPLIRAGNAVAAGDGGGYGDGSTYGAMPHGESASQTLPEAIPWDAVESAVDFVRRYPPALALTQTAVAARMLALSSAIAATLRQEREQEEQREQQHGLSAESVAFLKPSISEGAVAPSSPTEHNTWNRGPSEVSDCDLSNNTAGRSSSSRAEPGTAAAPSAASDLSLAATARALELVSGHPGILGYSPDALAARWKALEAAIMHAEAEIPPAASQVECAAVEQMVLQGNGRVAVQGLQASLNQEREPRQDANLYQGLKQGQDVDKDSPETTLRPEMDRTGLDRTSPDRAVKRSLEVKGRQSRAGRLPWRRQLLEGPPAAVARCLAASEERLQRLAFLASNAAIGATAETDAAALGGHEAGGSVDGVAAAGSSALTLKMDGPAITTGETAATIALDLKRGRRRRGSQRKERLVAQRHEHATTSADGRESRRTEETVFGASQRLKSLSLCTILAMSTERFDKRYPSFGVWLQQQQEAGMGTGARMKGATEAAVTWSSTGPAKTASTEKRQGQRGRR